MDDDSIDWIRCPDCEEILFRSEGRGDWFDLYYFFGRRLNYRDWWQKFFCVNCRDFINSVLIVGREFNGVSISGADSGEKEYSIWRASDGDDVLFAGKVKHINLETSEWEIYLKALGIDPEKLGVNLNFEVESDARSISVSNSNLSVGSLSSGTNLAFRVDNFRDYEKELKEYMENCLKNCKIPTWDEWCEIKSS